MTKNNNDNNVQKWKKNNDNDIQKWQKIRFQII